MQAPGPVASGQDIRHNLYSLDHIYSGVCMQAYECLAILEGTSSMAQQALENNAKLKRDDTRNISAYFNKVSFAPATVHRVWQARQ